MQGMVLLVKTSTERVIYLTRDRLRVLVLYRRLEDACNHTDLLISEATLGPVSILHESGQEILKIVFFKNETLEILFELASPLHNRVKNSRE